MEYINETYITITEFLYSTLVINFEVDQTGHSWVITILVKTSFNEIFVKILIFFRAGLSPELDC